MMAGCTSDFSRARAADEIATNLRPAALRRDLLQNLVDLPFAGEYLHHNAFDVTDKHGKDILSSSLCA
ncbi:hypothetical protein ACMX25_31515 [Caballeronia sp. 15715]|uniref:hypothetical protein n=1 Tax=Caballeronia sp. 15715 TaxID=3391030 RepID=UPI0039E3D4FE